MRNLRVLVSAGARLATAGCVETMGSGYPTTSYGNGYGNGYSSGYASKPSYYSQPIYQSRPTYYSAPQPVVMIQTRYVPVAVPTSAPRPSRMRDCDRDGVPDRYQRRQQQHYEAAIALAATALVLASTACMQPPDMSAASYGTAPEPYRP